MNIFYTDECPVRSAQNQCDKHVVKMILESAQMLCSVHHRYNSKVKNLYKPTHTKHPSTIWAGIVSKIMNGYIIISSLYVMNMNTDMIMFIYLV
jgi:hypothetical protein